MFILDDLLTAPFKGVMWILKEVVAAAEEEQAAESDRIKDRLRELYMLLETGQMTEAEFEAEESELLDRLDELEQAGAAAAEEGDEGEDEGDDEEDYEEQDDDNDQDGVRYAAAPDDDVAADRAAGRSESERAGAGPLNSGPGAGKRDDGD